MVNVFDKHVSLDLFEVWYRQKLLQSGEKKSNKDLQCFVKVRTVLDWKYFLKYKNCLSSEIFMQTNLKKKTAIHFYFFATSHTLKSNIELLVQAGHQKHQMSLARFQVSDIKTADFTSKCKRSLKKILFILRTNIHP